MTYVYFCNECLSILKNRNNNRTHPTNFITQIPVNPHYFPFLQIKMHTTAYVDFSPQARPKQHAKTTLKKSERKRKNPTHFIPLKHKPH